MDNALVRGRLRGAGRVCCGAGREYKGLASNMWHVMLSRVANSLHMVDSQIRGPCHAPFYLRPLYRKSSKEARCFFNPFGIIRRPTAKVWVTDGLVQPQKPK